MKIGYVNLRKVTVGFQKFLFGLTGKTNDDIHSDAGMRHVPFDRFNPIRVQRAVVPSFHFSQNGIRAALKRDMKVRHELTGMRHKFYRFIFKKVGFDGRNSQSSYSFHSLQGFDQFVEGMIVLFVSKLSFAVIPDVYAGENDLTNTFSEISRALLNTLSSLITSRYPACQGNGAKGAFIITSVLDFKKGAGSISNGIGAHIEIGLFDLAGVNFTHFVFQEIIQIIGNLELFSWRQVPDPPHRLAPVLQV